MSNRKNAITAELLPTEKAKTAKKGLYGLEDKDRSSLVILLNMDCGDGFRCLANLHFTFY